jgi:hypothetical protein
LAFVEGMRERKFQPKTMKKKEKKIVAEIMHKKEGTI